MIKIAFFSFLLLYLQSFAETSVFGAGDLNSPNPYGLTQTEEVLVKTKKITVNNEKSIKKVDSKIDQIDNKITALESLYEGDSRKLNSLSIEFNQQISQLEILQKKATTQNEKIEQLENEIEALQNNLAIQVENTKLLKDSFDKLVVLTNKINKEYVTKEEFNKLLSMLDKKETTAKAKSTKAVSNNSNVPNKPNNVLMQEARELFKKDYFTKAIPILEHLVASNHRPAECNYYLGEINYYRKNYKEALHYFKTSMLLYDKAKYLPRLLFHSAISFEKIGDKQNAKNFYSTIIDVYPDTDEAKQASKKIKQIK